MVMLAILALAIVAVLYRIEQARRLALLVRWQEAYNRRLELDLELVQALPDGAVGTRTIEGGDAWKHCGAAVVG